MHERRSYDEGEGTENETRGRADRLLSHRTPILIRTRSMQAGWMPASSPASTAGRYDACNLFLLPPIFFFFFLLFLFSNPRSAPANFEEVVPPREKVLCEFGEHQRRRVSRSFDFCSLDEIEKRSVGSRILPCCVSFHIFSFFFLLHFSKTVSFFRSRCYVDDDQASLHFVEQRWILSFIHVRHSFNRLFSLRTDQLIRLSKPTHRIN